MLKVGNLEGSLVLKSYSTVLTNNQYEYFIYEPVKDGVVIVALGGQLEEVLAGLGHRVAVQLQVQRSVVGVQPYIALRTPNQSYSYIAQNS